MPTTDNLGPVLYDVKDLVAARVNLDVAATAHTRFDVVFGAQATIDSCCPNGYGWVRTVRTFPYEVFPRPLTDFRNCQSPMLAAEVEIGVARCSPTLDENGNPPTQAEIEAVSDLVHLDRSALEQALLCDLIDYFDGELIAGAWTPLPDAGGCTGGTITLTFPFDRCCDEVA